MYYYNKKIHAKTNIVPDCVVRSEHLADILNAKSIRKEHLSDFITVRFIKTVSFWDSMKKFRRNTRRCSVKKIVINFSQYLQESTCAGVSFIKFQVKSP